MTATSDPLVGDVVDGRYEIISRAGRGGMATVYKALDRRLDRIVAVKVMRDDLEDDPDYAVRFDSEARAVANLSSEHIVSVFDQGVDRGRPYIVMEFIEGTNLKAVLVQQGALPPARAVALLEDIANGLAVAHAAGIVHRDVKPENVLISRTGDVKVTDFGLARQSDAPTMTVAEGVLGSLSYVSPERLLHKAPVDFRSDVYSAGVLAFEMLTGHKPFTGDTAAIITAHFNTDVPRPSSIVEGIPPWLDALVAACGSRNPDDRPKDGGELLARIRRGRAAMQAGQDDDPALIAAMTEPSGKQLPSARATGAPAATSLAVVAKGTGKLPVVAHEDTPPLPAKMKPADRVPAQRKKMFRRRRIFVAVIAAIVACALGAGAWWWTDGRYTTVPDIVNQSQEAATQLLQDAKLTIQTSTDFSETVPSGDVIKSDPPANTRIVRNSDVNVVISKGQERYPVPDVIGKAQADADTAITNGNLTVGAITEDYSETVPEGSVISTDPVAGTPEKKSTAVSMVVSKGRQPIPVPDLTGQSSGHASDTLKGLGLAPTTTTATSCSVSKDNVISQDPAVAGAATPPTLYKGDTVTLTVSSGPKMVQIPNIPQGTKPDVANSELTNLGLKVTYVHTVPDVLLQNVATAVMPTAGTTVSSCGTNVTLYIR